MKKAIPGKVCEEAVVKLATVQDREIIATYIGENKQRQTISLLKMNEIRAVGERVELGQIIASPHHNVRTGLSICNHNYIIIVHYLI